MVGDDSIDILAWAYLHGDNPGREFGQGGDAGGRVAEVVHVSVKGKEGTAVWSGWGRKGSAPEHARNEQRDYWPGTGQSDPSLRLPSSRSHRCRRFSVLDDSASSVCDDSDVPPSPAMPSELSPQRECHGTSRITRAQGAVQAAHWRRDADARCRYRPERPGQRILIAYEGDAKDCCRGARGAYRRVPRGRVHRLLPVRRC
jgi:hypothetical protein